MSAVVIEDLDDLPGHIYLGESGKRNLEDWGYCAGWDRESDSLVAVRKEGVEA